MIIDDEPLARLVIREYLKDNDSIEIVGEAGDGFEGAKLIQELKPDLLFLDVQMPKLNGFEMLEVLPEAPKVIFTTAFDEFALKAFEVHALDYLMKPFTKDRLEAALKHVETNPKTETLKEVSYTQPDEQTRVVIKDGSEIRIIPTNQITYLEAYDDYVKIHTTKGTFLKKKTMSAFEQSLPSQQFMRIHRSYIINLDELTKIESWEKNSYIAILKSGAKIPISRNSYSDLKGILGV